MCGSKICQTAWQVLGYRVLCLALGKSQSQRILGRIPREGGSWSPS